MTAPAKNRVSSTRARQCWLVKQEPSAYSWDDLVADGSTAWTGVRNFQARNNLKAMRRGDEVFFYHSVIGKEIVGIAKVIRAAYPDPTATEGDWVCVDIAPVRPLKKPITLETIKADPSLHDLPLLRNSRLSVQPVPATHFRKLVASARQK